MPFILGYLPALIVEQVEQAQIQHEVEHVSHFLLDEVEHWGVSSSVGREASVEDDVQDIRYERARQEDRSFKEGRCYYDLVFKDVSSLSAVSSFLK